MVGATAGSAAVGGERTVGEARRQGGEALGAAVRARLADRVACADRTGAEARAGLSAAAKLTLQTTLRGWITAAVALTFQMDLSVEAGQKDSRYVEHCIAERQSRRGHRQAV